MTTTDQSSLAHVFPGDGEMAERMRELDWSKTSLGPVETWSISLKTTVSILLSNRFPLLLWWGADYIQLYNDAYKLIPGQKHPTALGQPANECWPEIWHIIGPLIDTPFCGGPATWMEDIFLEINRHGFIEESHFTIAYSPILDPTAPSGIGGVLATVHEITEKVVGERRLRILRELAAQSTASENAERACEIAWEILSSHPEDIPFVWLYLVDAGGECCSLVSPKDTKRTATAHPASVRLDAPVDPDVWRLRPAIEERKIQFIDIPLELRRTVSTGGRSGQPLAAAVVPIPSTQAEEVSAVMVIGISPWLALDEQYEGFLDILRTQIASGISNARSIEAERRRAESLAELNRAKTNFFDNVSHEFRTPLTLMLSPIEELISESSELSPTSAGKLEMVVRNGRRLLRLVNTLLDFSRIEAGRVQASFQRTDISEFTADLASTFRAAVEGAGLRFTVKCPSLDQPVYVDPDMWEKVVLNLISNAFKFTFEGEIEVSVASVDGHMELRVRDTGIGIPSEEVPKLFERFHRLEVTRSRTHEGSGIGLALVLELVKMHGGAIRVESTLGRGAVFIVSIPFGHDHLPAERVGASSRGPTSIAIAAAPFVEEALRWLPDEAPMPTPEQTPLPLSDTPSNEAQEESHAERPTVLIADDNADMRQYLARLLGEHYNVVIAPDGQSALETIRVRRPDLVLADVMMPQLDGFGLLKHLRSTGATRSIPIILLSARAGEESRVEGLAAGADDYLVKPFSARELLARVESNLKLSRLRQEAEDALAERVKERTAELFASNEQLQGFTYAVAHDLRQHIRGISLNAAQLGRDAAANLSESNLDDLRRLEQDAKKLARLVDDLLAHAKLGRQQLRLEPLSLSDLAGRVMEELRIEGACPPEMLAEIEPNLEAVGDALLLGLALHNLFENACKYSRRSDNPRVRLSRDAEGFLVTDNGIGFDARFGSKIFDPFERLHDADEYPGSGIGLTSVKQIIERHGGSIWATGEVGKGATFHFTLNTQAAGAARTKRGRAQ